MANKKNAGKYAKKASGSGKNTRTVLIVSICIAVVVLIGILVLGYLYLGSGVTPGKILDHVTIAGVDVGGMSKNEAVSAVEAAVQETYTGNPMVVQVLEHSIEIPANVSRVTLDAEAAVDAAYALGRTGSSSQRKAEQQQAATTGIDADITPYLSVDAAAVRAELQKLLDNYSTILTQTSYELVGERPDLVDQTSDDPSVNPLDVEHQKLVITVGTPGYDLDIDKIYQMVLDGYCSYQFLIEVDCTVTEPDPFDLEALYAEVCVEPIDAQMDPETFEVIPHSYGYRFDLAEVEAQLTYPDYGQVLEFPFSFVEPQVTTASLEELLFRDVLSSYTTKASYNSNRNENLRLACEAINGTVLNPGDVFDYNKVVGERTTEKGYRPGASYVGSETVYTVGGGICQVSSTIYYCALMADLEIVTRYEHGFPSSYIPLGMDATVSWGGPEFRFKNNTQYPIRIESSASGGNVTIKLIGTDTKDYYVKMEYTVLSVDEWETVYVEMEADNEKGYKDGETITTPYTGYSVKTYRCKYSKETNELISKEYETSSKYNRRDKQVCKIITEETEPSTQPSTAPIDPPETTVPPTTEESTPPESSEPEESTGTPGSGGDISEDG